ncbi:MAG: substrate-binding domain-containing protein, partial [Ruthenibacterium sp.]
VATEYLMRHGNQNIAFIKGPDKTSATKERFAGYVAALQKHNFDLRQQLVLNGDFTFQSGYQAVQILHTRGVIFDAILASNDVMALGALKALQEYRYQVPQEIEVMGFDDIQASDWTNPPLTTMRQPLHELGTQAACAILSMVEKRTVFERTMRIEAELICRKTTRQQEIAACGVSVIKNEGAK